MHPVLLVSSVSESQEVDGVPEPDDSLLYGRLKNSETLRNLDSLLLHLTESKRGELSDLIQKYSCLFGDVPTCTNWIEHDVDVGNPQPIKQRFYRMSRET